MKALILAAGLGTRLGELTRDMPKVLLTVKGEPILSMLINKILKLGIEEITVNTHFKSELVKSFIRNQEYSKYIDLVEEKELLGTAGTLKQFLMTFDNSDFMVMHGDNYFKDDLRSLVQFHETDCSKSIMTMATFISNSPERCGVVTHDSDGFVNGFYEKNSNPPSKVANAAIYIFKPMAVREILYLNNEEIDISKDLIPKLVGRFKTFPLNSGLIDIGTPIDYLIANQKEV